MDGTCRRTVWLSGLVLCLSVLGAGCRREASARPLGHRVEIQIPLGLPPLPIPKDNPPTAETIALGRKLFYDRRLSQGDAVACSFCHRPEEDFTDGMAVSRGVAGVAGVRNAPTILNAAYLPLQFWDGRAATLEQQAASPIADPTEMNQPHGVSVAKLGNDPVYRRMFRAAFGTEQATLLRVEEALASFERTVLTGDSPFDRYQYGGNKGALTPQQVRGLQVFFDASRGNCAACHSIGSQSALFTDGSFHNTGEGVGDDSAFSDEGRYHLTRVKTDQGAFLTPTLRNVARTAPYMHDGKLKTLAAVVDFYAGQGNSNPYLDPEMKKISLTGQDRADLTAFLESLTGTIPGNVGPPEKEQP